MKSHAILAATAAVLPLAHSITLKEPRDASPRVFGLDIKRAPLPSSPDNSDIRIRRRQTVSQTLDNVQGSFYFANISLGTPAQDIQVTIDTGSSDLWVNAPNSTLCTRRARYCNLSGTYDADKSSSGGFVNSDFNISYADGSGASGNYLTDTFAFGGKKLDAFQFGVGYVSTSYQGVLGVGYSANEAAVQYIGAKPYNNLPLAMVEAGQIASPAYSLWLNDLEASTGVILFGGVDTEKYEGELATLPILPGADGTRAEFLITLTGVRYAPRSGSSTTYSAALPAAVLLDSGSTYSYLPNDLISEIYTSLNAQYDSSQGAAYVSCSVSGTLEFTFSEPTISVDIQEELLIGITDQQGNPIQANDGTQLCILGLAPSPGSFFVLGDTFLRSAYVVYDLQNNEISLAQTTFNSTRSNIREITSGSDSVPGATLVQNAVTSVAAQTGGARIGGGGGFGGSGASATAVPTGLGGSGSGGSGSSTNAAAASIPRPTGQAALGYFAAAGVAVIAAAVA